MSNRAPRHKSQPLLWIPFLLAVTAVAAAIAARWWQRRRTRGIVPAKPSAPPAFPPGLQGLTEAEAEARRLQGQDNAIPFRPLRSRRVILRDNLYTFLNLNLAGLAVAQLLLGLPLDALLSMGMIVVNAGLNITQEMLARIRLREIEEATRAQATVIREGKVRSIDANDIVQGDVLVVGPGDQLLADGQLVGEGQLIVDESMLTGKSRRAAKYTGDNVYAGGFCISGRAAYEAQTVGTERVVVKRLDTAQAGKEELTPLEHVVDRVLRILLIVVLGLTGVLLLRYFLIDTGINTEVLADAVSVIFSIAPASLFFMIFLTYAAGTADLGKLGALVHRARSIESLAQATTVCFAEAGILTGTYVEIEPSEPRSGQAQLAESRIRQILGDFARSTSMDSQAIRAMTAAFEGNRRIIHEEAPFLSAYGWSAVAFDDDDLRGVYVLGEPQLLEEHLLTPQEEPIEPEADHSPLAALRRRLPSPRRLFRRSEPETPGKENQPVEPEKAIASEQIGQSGKAVPPAAAESPAADASGPPQNGTSTTARPSRFRQLLARARSVLPGSKPEAPQTEAADDSEAEEIVLLFAYRPEVGPLHDADGSPKLPDSLLPLCSVRYAERVRADTVETIQGFLKTGMDIKIVAAGAAGRVAASLQQAGLSADSGLSLRSVSGKELAEMEPKQLGHAVSESTIFGHMSPEQAGVVVQALRKQGQVVAVVGDRLNDLPAMRQANLAIARRSSSQTLLGTADIVLLKDSPRVLLDVLTKGQRIVNGLLDVLKLYLTQMIYLTLLIVGIRLFAYGFPYLSKQGSAIAVFTLSIPAVGLSLWASAGVLSTKDLRWLLVRFVIPAAITTGVVGVVVYSWFLQRTGDIAYAQLTLLYTLITSGLLLVLLVKPPSRLWVGGALLSGDRRFTAAVLFLLAAFLGVSRIPLTQELLGLGELRQPSDYLVIAAAVGGWVILLRAIWWTIPFLTKSERLSPIVEKHPRIPGVLSRGSHGPGQPQV